MDVSKLTSATKTQEEETLASQFKDAFDIYTRQFTTTREIVTKIGPSEKDGWQGAMRDSVHVIEDQINNATWRRRPDP